MALDNFVLQNTNPLEAYLQGAGGIQTLQNNQQIMDARVAAQQLAQQQAQAAQAEAVAKQQAQLAMYNETDPLKHAKLVAQYQTAYPDDYKAVTDASKTMSDAQKTNLLGLSSKLANVSATGNYDLGQQILDQQIESMKGNVPDDQLAAAQTFQKRWAVDPKGVVTGLTMAARAIDPSTFDTNNKVAADTAAVVGEEGRKVAMHPLEMAAKQATTDKTRAETASELQKMGLTSAQIAKTQVEAEQQLEDLRNGGSGKAPTEGQAKANLFGSRALKANTNLTMLELDPANIPHVPNTLLSVANFTPSALGGLTEKEQSYLQYKRDFINSILRKESGAAIGQDEFDNAEKQYFPQLGEGANIIAQKAANRKDAAGLILAEAGSFAGKGMAAAGAKTATKASIIAAAKAHGVNPMEAMKQWTQQGNILK